VSKLTFRDESSQIVLTSGHRLVGIWDAHNVTAGGSKGPWPLGKYPWSHYNPHVEAGLLPAAFHAPFGATGIHVFSVHRRPGLGVHAGRTFGKPFQVGGVTLGCIRVPSEAMYMINDTHRLDPLQEIEITK
jgi:hypothetical protein